MAELLDERSEFARREAMFDAYMLSEEMQAKRLERLKLADAGVNKAEARAMLWNLCRREDNPAEGCIFFIENFGWTFDPRRNPKHIPFFLFEYQKEAIRALVEHIDGGRDILLEKSRDMGITWLLVWVFLWYWMFHDGINMLMGSYKEKLVDDRTDDSLFGRLDYGLDSLPKWILPKGYNRNKHRTKLKIINPANGNLLSGDTMNPDFGRGSRKTAIFFDELGSWDYAKDGWESCGDVTNCRIANSTPKGYNFYAKLRNDGIDVLTMHWSQHPLKDQQWYDFEVARRSPEEVAQELDISYSKSQEGRVYPEWDENSVHFGMFEYDSGLPLYVGWDFGKTDDTAIIWAQPFDGKLRIVDTFSKNGQNIDFFVPFITGLVNSDSYRYTKAEFEMIEMHKNWKIGVHFGDPAGRFKNGVTDSTVVSVLRDHGIIVNYKDIWKEHQNRKRASKALIRDGLQINRNSRTEEFSMCMENAAYPTPTVEGEKVVRSQKPKHDWTSHYRSSFEYMALGISEFVHKRSAPVDKIKRDSNRRGRGLRY